jgi:hypothetical protein
MDCFEKARALAEALNESDAAAAYRETYGEREAQVFLDYIDRVLTVVTETLDIEVEMNHGKCGGCGR